MSWTRRPLTPDAGRVPLDEEVVGHGDRGGHLARRGRTGRRRDGLGQVGRGVLDGGRRAVLALAAEHVEARVLVGVRRVAERVEDARAELDRVGAAELLLREADRERGRAARSTGLTGVTVITGVMFSDQLSSVPVAPVWVLVSWSVQTPSDRLSARSRPCEPPRSRAPVGLNVPVKGAVPEVIEVAAESSKTVLMKFEPVPPTPENRGICVPSGAIRTAVRAESVGNAALSWTVSLATLNVPLKLGTVSVELSVPGPVEVAAGIVWPTAVRGEVLRAGDRAGRAHDLEHLAGGERADLHGPVERHVERAGRAVDDQVVGCRCRSGTEAASSDLRAGDDQRQRVLVERGD